jgi:putative transposase
MHRSCAGSDINCIVALLPAHCLAGVFANEVAIFRLVGAILLEQDDEWAVQRRYMRVETLASLGNNPDYGIPAVA